MHSFSFLILSKKHKSLILSLIIFLLSVSLYSYNLFSSYNFDNDFARDLVEIKKIIDGNLTFIGPAATIGIQTGPYYYYLFAPVAMFSNLNINIILITNVLFFALSIAYLSYCMSIKYGFSKSILFSFSVALLPMMFISARNPGNAFSYIPFLIVLLTLISVNNLNNRKILIVSGILSGLVINFHYSNTIIITPLLIYLIFILKKKRDIAIYMASLLVTFTPLIFFEIKNNFVMSKNIFLNHAYENFVENKQLPGSEPAKENIYDNLIFISTQITPYMSLNPIYLFIVGLIISWKKFLQKEVILFLLSIISCTILIVVLRSQFAFYYTFPFIIFLVFSGGFMIMKSKYYLLLLLFIIFELFSIPVNVFNTSHRPYLQFEEAVNFVIENKLSTLEKFNILQVRPDTIISPHGNEYRYFFMKNGFSPLPITDYESADQLIIFSEIPNFDLKDLSNTEFSQFGNKYKIKKINYKKLTIFNLIK